MGINTLYCFLDSHGQKSYCFSEPSTTYSHINERNLQYKQEFVTYAFFHVMYNIVKKLPDWANFEPFKVAPCVLDIIIS